MDSAAEAALSDLYDRYFDVVPADTSDLLDAAHALRYQVYCVEHAFEDPAEQPGTREWDRYDAQSVHAVLISKRSGDVVGCVRLILPGHDAAALPIRRLLTAADGARLDTFDSRRTAEISRYAIAKKYRRRKSDGFYPDVDSSDPQINDIRRLAPHMSLGLMCGVGRLASRHGVKTVCAAMTPSLLRLLERFGLTFERLGPLTEHHGLRQPCVAECEHLLLGMAEHNREYYQAVGPAYRGTGVPGQPALLGRPCW